MDLDLWDCLGRVKFIVKFHRTDLVICSHSREGKTLSNSQINTVNHIPTRVLVVFKNIYCIFLAVKLFFFFFSSLE